MPKIGIVLTHVKSIAEHSAILSAFIKLPFVIKIVLSIFEWPLRIGFTVIVNCVLHVHKYVNLGS